MTPHLRAARFIVTETGSVRAIEVLEMWRVRKIVRSSPSFLVKLNQCVALYRRAGLNTGEQPSGNPPVLHYRAGRLLGRSIQEQQNRAEWVFHCRAIAAGNLRGWAGELKL